MARLYFSFGNAKTKAVILDLPAGWSCPFADKCLSKADRKTGKITDGENTCTRCFAAAQECFLPKVREKRWKNFEALMGKTKWEIVELIERDMPKFINLVRIHSSGDYFNQDYFDAWLEIAGRYPNITFYSYTKSLPFWIKRLNVIPKNFKLVASYGGKKDMLIAKFKLRFCKIVLSIKEAIKNKLRLDHDDSLSYDDSIAGFALLIHGTQPAGTPAAKAWQKLRGTKNGGYSRKRK